MLAGEGNSSLDVIFHLREALKVATDDLLRLFGRDVQLLCQALGADAVDDPKVEDLCFPPHLFGDRFWDYSEAARRRLRVDVFTSGEGGAQPFVARKVGEDTQLNLRIIGTQQAITFGSDEGAPNLFAPFATNGDVLKVGFG